MKLIVGLGNPETVYDGSRHNLGFFILDSYANANKLQFRSKTRFNAMVAELSTAKEKTLLIKPTTFYNLSGEAVQAITNFYKIPARNVLIVHDEIMLPIGTFRTRLGGSDAGNNGIKSISQHITPNTARIRIGIKQPLRDQIDDKNFVLGQLTTEEKEVIGQLLPAISEAIDTFINGSFAPTTRVQRPIIDS